MTKTFGSALDALAGGRREINMTGLWGSSKALFLWELASFRQASVVVVSPTPKESEALFKDFCYFAAGLAEGVAAAQPVYFPPWDVLPYDVMDPDPAVVAALVSLKIMGAPFGFMAFLGVISLVGVIVSHIIVLFDYIEEMRERGEPLRRAVIDAALVRLRPVLVTVLATVGGLIPLALEGGPLWEPMCYVQIAGMLVATLVTLVIVPVLYVVFVEDLHLVRWDTDTAAPIEGHPCSLEGAGAILAERG